MYNSKRAGRRQEYAHRFVSMNINDSTGQLARTTSEIREKHAASGTIKVLIKNDATRRRG